jgi:hypothetical protein
MQIFIQLNEDCSALPAEEVALMLDNVRAQVTDESCQIDTSGILSSAAAKQIALAPCETDNVPICAASITAGVVSCKVSLGPSLI